MRRADPFDKRAATLSVLLHGLVFALAWVSSLHHVAPMEFTAIEIELVSPPAAAQAEEPRPAAERVVVERPRAEPPPPEPEPDITPVQQPEPEPEPEPEPPAPEPEPAREPEPETTPAVTPEPEAQRTNSGENINVRIEGLRRDYPAYYENIIRQVNRCFVSRWRQGGNWTAEVLFTIRRDGVAADLEFGKRSGNLAFDYEAMGAVDCAGQGRFGPLPEDFPWEAVRIRFTFEPPSEQ